MRRVGNAGRGMWPRFGDVHCPFHRDPLISGCTHSHSQHRSGHPDLDQRDQHATYDNDVGSASDNNCPAAGVDHYCRSGATIPSVDLSRHG